MAIYENLFDATVQKMLADYADYDDAYIRETQEVVYVNCGTADVSDETAGTRYTGSANLANMADTVLAELIFAISPYDTSAHSSAVASGDADYDLFGVHSDAVVIQKQEGGGTYRTVADIEGRAVGEAPGTPPDDLVIPLVKPIIRDNGDTEDEIRIIPYVNEGGGAAQDVVLYVHKLQLINPT